MQRDIIPELIQWIDDPFRKPLILRGARQVGKSTVVRMLAKATNRKLVELNLERHLALNDVFATYDIKKIIASIESLTRMSLSEDNSLLFLDEIQATPSAISALRYFYEDFAKLPVIAAGSLLELVLGEKPMEIPVGRIQYLYMGPMTFEEFLEAKGEVYFLDKIRSYVIGEQWPQALHSHGLDLLKQFLVVGGMPAAVSRSLIQPGSYGGFVIELQSIIDTFKDDFAKYTSRQVLLPILQQVYDRAPRNLARALVLSEMVPGVRHEYIKSAVSLLVAAHVLLLVKQNDAAGIPLAAGQREKSPKLFWLDVGLVNRMLNLEPTWLDLDVSLIHNGAVAEQFVAQHLNWWHGCYVTPSLNYWVRDGKGSAAEVDFVVQLERSIIPIEVKSGPSGSLRSLHQFLIRKSPPFGVRFNTDLPGIQKIEHEVRVEANRDVRLKSRLVSLPLYMVGQLKRLMGKV